MKIRYVKTDWSSVIDNLQKYDASRVNSIYPLVKMDLQRRRNNR